MQVLRSARGAAVITVVGLPVGLLAHSAEAGPDIKYNTVILTGDEAAGTGGAEHRVFFDTRINNSGDVSFRGNLVNGVNGVDTSNNVGLWSTSGGVLDLRARKGDIVPGTGGAKYGNLTPLLSALTDAGDLIFGSSLTGSEVGIDSTNNSGIWSASGGSLDMIARKGDAAPGAGGAVFNAWTGASVQINRSGDVVFTATLQQDAGIGVDDSNDIGIWATAGGSLSLVAREGSDAPGTGGADYALISSKVMNNSGQVAFQSSLHIGENGVTIDNNEGIWSNASGALALIKREGDVDSGVANGVFRRFLGVALNDAGDVAFKGDLRTDVAGVDSTNNDGLWSISGGTTALLAREGDTAPGAGAARFSTFATPRMNAAGDIFYTGSLITGENGVDSTNNSGLWAVTDDTTTLIARTGSDAPGAGGADFAGGFNVALNDVGDFVFMNSLQTGENGVDSTNDRGLWAYSDSLDEMRLIVREGDLFDVSSDPLVPDLRTIQTIQFSGALGLNNSGVLVFSLIFTDTSRGVFTASIPAPGTAGLLALAGLAASRRRR